MSLSVDVTAEIIKKYQKHDRDTATPQVQIALLTARLHQLNNHFKTNKKDHHSRRGLMILVGRRKKLMNYLQKRDSASYKEMIVSLGLRK
jgi:small subunit ribosomal protein S15